MKARSGHFRFNNNIDYKDLLPIYKEVFMRFLEETEQIPMDEPDFVDVLVEENLIDIRSNRKPQGFNRSGAMRLIFPMSEKVEFYIYGRQENSEVSRIANIISRLLEKGGFEHQLEWDKMLLFEKKA